MTREQFLSNLWRWKCGIPEKEYNAEFSPVGVRLDLDRLRETQMSGRFIELMANRVVLGTLRYGDWRTGNNGRKYDRVGSIKRRLELFRESGNTESSKHTGPLRNDRIHKKGYPGHGKTIIKSQ